MTSRVRDPYTYPQVQEFFSLHKDEMVAPDENEAPSTSKRKTHAADLGSFKQSRKDKGKSVVPMLISLRGSTGTSVEPCCLKVGCSPHPSFRQNDLALVWGWVKMFICLWIDWAWYRWWSRFLPWSSIFRVSLFYSILSSCRSLLPTSDLLSFMFVGSQPRNRDNCLGI